jgi:hypothetical protein
MKPLTNALKKILNGLAHADAGEYLTPRQKSAYLQNTAVNVVNSDEAPPVLSEKAMKSTRRRVAMYMGSTLPSKMMDYVIETCSSLDHDLTVLTFETGAVSSALLEPYVKQLEKRGIALETVKLSGEPISGLARYLRNHSEIAFMTCKNTGYLGRSYINGTQAKNALPVPVVVVVVDPKAAQAQPAAQGEEAGMSNTA